MNPGLIRRALRETIFTTALFGMAVMLFAAALNYAFPRFQARLSAGRMQLPKFMQDVRSAMLGVETGGMSASEIATSMAWSHPIILAVLFAHAIVFSTRVPASEIERGTIDSLMGLPISRWQLWLSETGAWIISGILLLFAAVLGSRIGNHFIAPEMRPALASVLKIQVNIFGMYAVVAGLGFCSSSLTSRRGRAVLATLMLVLGSFLINYLSLVWDEAKRFNVLSILHYFRPLIMMTQGQWPWRDLAILYGVGGGLWLLGGVVMSRRDLATT